MAAKLGEEEIKKLVAATRERRKKIVDLKLAVLEGHLVMEEALNGFLEESRFNPAELNLERVNFSHEMQFRDLASG